MGDLTSSLVALGFHEKIDQPSSDLPDWALELRKSIFARIYWAEKALSMFLGRPPRLLLGYCNFQVPEFRRRADGSGLELIDFVADTQCGARFAVLKEHCLEMHRTRHLNGQAEGWDKIRQNLEQLWLDLPAHFRLTTSLAESKGSPFERDFLANQRLEYLHTHFHLGLTCLQSSTDPSDSLLGIAAQMLSLIVEMIMLRSKLVNSGSHLLWKVRPPPA